MTAIVEPTKTKTERKVIYLRHDDDLENNVMVDSEHFDPIFVTPAEAVKSIVQGVSPLVEMIQEYTASANEQIELMLKKLKAWSKEHSNLLCRADVRFLSLSNFLFVVMQNDKPYDFELSDKLTELDIDFANDAHFNSISLNVLAIPRCSSEDAQAFLDWERNIVIVDFTSNA